jgi:methane monooxygenase PmoA-like
VKRFSSSKVVNIETICRRLSWELALLVSGAAAVAQNPAPKSSTAPLDNFRFETIGNKSLGLWEGDRPVFVYHFGAVTSSNAPNARSRSNYFHPLYGLDGEVLTDDFPKDHDYHRGLYWGWSHIRIADQEYDSWSLRGIRYEFQRWLAKETRPGGARLGVETGWFVGNKQIMRETVWTLVHASSASNRAIDFELTWTPTDRPVTLSGAEGKSYGGLTLRFGPRSKTTITVPGGRTSGDLVVTNLPWADLSGDLKKDSGDLSGIALFVDSRHPDFPPTWMTRHYGLLAVGWPGITPKTLPDGESVTCRYRIWIHRGSPDAAEIQRAYADYCDVARPQRGGKE